VKNLLLNKIRLSWYFGFFFILFFLILNFLPRFKFEAGALTLFSVNSFLYGFYISPILGAQKARIEELHRIVRAESNAIFTIMLATKGLRKPQRSNLQSKFSLYLTQTSHKLRGDAEKTYEGIISYCLDYDGKDKDKMDKLLEKIVANQQNRTNLSMQLSNRVYSNEWMIMMVLFSITLSFILLLDTGSSLILRTVTALLCTSLTMLVLILIKLSTLSHKKAKQMWEPFESLLSTHYYRIDKNSDD
jgi:hypothetical protein